MIQSSEAFQAAVTADSRRVLLRALPAQLPQGLPSVPQALLRVLQAL